MHACASDSRRRAAAPWPWAAGPVQPRLTTGEVHVWLADLDDCRPAGASSLGGEPGAVLTAEELRRAGRIIGEERRRRWARARALLRELLGAYLALDPADVRLAYGPRGKPELAGVHARARRDPHAAGATRPRRAPRLHFNLSHSAGTALYAFSAAAAVGVDVEAATRQRDTVALAMRVFGAAEAERLAAIDPSARLGAFAGAWVRHEAALKCTGAGLGMDARTAQGRRRAGDPAAPPAWVAELDLGPGFAAAVAASVRPTALRCWVWTGGRPAATGS